MVEKKTRHQSRSPHHDFIEGIWPAGSEMPEKEVLGRELA
jgi:hypothetical protein